MKHWPLPTHPPGPGAAALGGVVSALGDAGFADAALEGFNAAGLRAASWSVYRVWRERPPVLHLSASLGVADSTQSCFQAYREGLYRRDRSFDLVAPGQRAVLRMHADEAPNAAHREAIYRRHAVLERLSVVQRDDDGALFAVNLYHHEHQGCFAEGELAGFAEMAALLLAAVRRHLALAPGSAVAPEAGMAVAAAAAAPAIGARQVLQQRCPALTVRELDVCERLLRGWSYDGIAADMQLSVATVKTYRARAFARLGMHFKSELFAAIGPAH